MGVQYIVKYSILNFLVKLNIHRNQFVGKLSLKQKATEGRSKTT